MRLLLQKAALMAALLSGVLTLFLFCPWQRQEPFRNLPKKHRLLARAAGKKIILVGGSGVGYGLSARIIQSLLPDYRVVNMGVNAGLGLQFNLNEIKPYLKAGDIVLLSPEYGNFSGGYRGGIQILKAINIEPDLRRFVSPGEFWRLIRLHGFDFFPLKAQTYFDGLANRLTDSSMRIDEFGDNITRSISRDVSRMPFTLKHNEAALNECIRLLNEFDAHCRGMGVQVFLSYPSLPTPQFESNRREIAWLHQLLARDGAVRLLHAPADVVFTPHDFDDTVYHLNEQGRERRSQKLACLLAPILAGR